MSSITRSGAITKGVVTTGLAMVARVRDDKIPSHLSINVANSRPVRYNKKIRRNAESMGTPAWLQTNLVAEQSVSKWRSEGTPLAHKGQDNESLVS